MVQGGASLAVPSVLRTSVESAAYAVAFNEEKDWWQLWITRENDPSAKKKLRSREFTRFVRDCLKSRDEGLAAKYKELCDLLVDLGAHPSYVGLDAVTSLGDLGQGEVLLEFSQISNNVQRQDGLMLLTDVGVFLIAMFALIWPDIEVEMDIWGQVSGILDGVWDFHKVEDLE